MRFSDTLFFRDVAWWFASGSPDLENSLVLVGPGYGYILYVWGLIVGWNAWGHLALQLVIAALNCVLISVMCSRLGLKKSIGLLAGYFHAFSLTAITLSCTLYTETWFIFFTLLTLITFLDALRAKTIGHYFIFAAFAFCAAMVRSVGQFYPIVLFGILVLYAIYQKIRRKAGITLMMPLFGTLLALSLILSWPIRNYVKHGIFTISETGTRAAKRYWLAAAVSGTYEEDEINRRRKIWDEQMHNRFGTKTPSLSQRHQFDISVVRDTVMKYPARMLSGYLHNVWVNMTKDSRLQYEQTPQLNPLWFFYTKKLATGLGTPVFWLILFGGAVLMMRGKTFAGVFLVVLYAYLGLITGATFWQGSRIFLPGQVAWAPLLSVSFLWGYEKAMSFRRRLR